MKKRGGIISFEVNKLEVLHRLLSNLRVITLGESLGGVESLIAIPNQMSRAVLPQAMKDHLGINKTLVRLSVDIENIEDIIRDLNVDLE